MCTMKSDMVVTDDQWNAIVTRNASFRDAFVLAGRTTGIYLSAWLSCPNAIARTFASTQRLSMPSVRDIEPADAARLAARAYRIDRLTSSRPLA